ncbi:MAG: ABC transporter ATP-binding protein [Burkholderiales bacterium]|nr:ABC transporter ATP-binding protein [Burkholderiales bacterium]
MRQAALAAWRTEDEPLVRMDAAAAELGLSFAPAQVSITDAAWIADARSPLVTWSDLENRWLVIRKRGVMGVSISTAETPLELERISRRDLAHRLGHRSGDDRIDVGTIHLPNVFPDTGGAPGAGSHRSHDDSPGPVRRYLDVLRPEWPEIFAIVIFSVVTGLLYLSLPLAVNALVSNISFGNQSAPFIQALVLLGLALFGALFLSAVIRGLQVYTAEIIKRRLFVRLVADLSYRLPRVSGTAFENTHAPELVNRFLDIVTIQSATERIVMRGIPLGLTLFIGTIVLGLYHPTLFAFAIALYLILGAAMLLGRGAVDASIDESRVKYEMVGWLEELARVPTLFKGPGGFAFATRRADEIAHRYLGARRRFFRIFMRQFGMLLFLEIFATAALLIVGGWLVLEQALTLGQLVASELIVTSIVYAVSRLESVMTAWYSGLAAIDKIGHLTDLAPERTSGETVNGSADGMSVQCTDVKFAYPSGRAVLSGFNLDVEPGQVVAVGGPHGRGASTVLNLVFGLLTPAEGHIRLDGLDIRSWNLERLRSRVCLLRASDFVDGTLVENVRLGRDDIGLDRVTAALDAVGLLAEVLDLHDGLDTHLISGGLPLSSNQRLRLLVARAVVLQPRLLLLDDLLDGTDPAVRQMVFRILDDRSRGWTVLIGTRDPAVTEFCHRALSIDDSHGLLLSASTPAPETGR